MEVLPSYVPTSDHSLITVYKERTKIHLVTTQEATFDYADRKDKDSAIAVVRTVRLQWNPLVM